MNVHISKKKSQWKWTYHLLKNKEKRQTKFLIQPLTFHQVRNKKTIKYKKILTLKWIRVNTFSKTFQYVPKFKNSIYINGGNCRIQKRNNGIIFLYASLPESWCNRNSNFQLFPWNCAVNKVESIFYQKNQFWF